LGPCPFTGNATAGMSHGQIRCHHPTHGTDHGLFWSLPPDALRSYPEMIPLLIGLAVLICLGGVALVIDAVQRNRRLRELESRVAGVEAALQRLTGEARATVAPPQLAAPPQSPVASGPTVRRSLESVIGEKWLGWLAILLIFCAAAFFLKYAFENRWIGEG